MLIDVYDVHDLVESQGRRSRGVEAIGSVIVFYPCTDEEADQGACEVRGILMRYVGF